MISIMNQWLLIPFFVLAVLVIWYRMLYLRTARRITILESTLKSPVIQHLSSSMNGLATIRAFNAQARFRYRFDVLQNDHMSAYFTFFCAARWFVGTVESLQVIFIAGVAFTMAIMAEQFSGSSVGLIIYSAILFCSQFQWMVKNWTEVETQMISVDRLNFYSSVPSEAALYSSPEQAPPTNWPQHGRLQFDQVTLRYEPTDRPVLRSLSFTIEAGQRIGIVGRTGAGKSSIIAALFRLCEVEGRIYLDGIDCARVGLHELRRRLSIIPQEPMLFTGTVRSNLDPFNEHADDRLWHVLRELQLHDIVKQMPGALSAHVSDGATAFSVGQKQLLCLARAMLRESRVLVLDEATANCDPLTDQLIQKTVRKEFAGRTILIVAHRLQTVIDADRILLMDAGQVVEFDSPARLLARPDSSFSQLVRSSGPNAEYHLKKLALQSFIENDQAKDEQELNWLRSQLLCPDSSSATSEKLITHSPIRL
jgi:ATP-binding cassette subfamily C (CFTR/MRP) protein 4